jgi:hypothetical protein
MPTKNPIGYEYDAQGRARGRDPREMTTADLIAMGFERMSPMQALRDRCIDCCAGSQAEVRTCVSLNCPAWPFRMGTNPWREYTPEQLASLRERGKALAARGKAVSYLPSDVADPFGAPQPTPSHLAEPQAKQNTGAE